MCMEENKNYKKQIEEWIDMNQCRYIQMCDQLYDSQNTKTSLYEAIEYQLEDLKEEGFQLQESISKKTGRLVYKYGIKGPVIGLTGIGHQLDQEHELYLNQKSNTKIIQNINGGWHLLETSVIITIIGLKRILEKQQIRASLVYYGCPMKYSEEYKYRKGKFGYKDVDILLTWIPGSYSAVKKVRYKDDLKTNKVKNLTSYIQENADHVYKNTFYSMEEYRYCRSLQNAYGQDEAVEGIKGELPSVDEMPSVVSRVYELCENESKEKYLKLGVNRFGLFYGTCYPYRVPVSHWPKAGLGKSSVAHKGVLCASKIIAMTALDMLFYIESVNKPMTFERNV